MPTRFNFDLESNYDSINDSIGVEAENINQATVQAVAAIREMQREDDFETAASDWELVIRDEAGNELRRLPLIHHIVQRAS